MFMDYLTKWPEVYATADQTAPTIAKLLVEMISHHEMPNQLLSDQGLSFLSRLLLASTARSPFFLMYGRDPQLPTELVLSSPVECEYVQSDDYKSKMVYIGYERNVGDG